VVKVLHVVGARPNFMKAAPVYRALAGRGVPQLVVHTGQHYDEKMSKVFFEDLGLPQPDVNLKVGSGSHALMTGEVMKRIEPVMQSYAPGRVLVYGDVNSTVAAALVAAKLLLPVAHVEAGLRSFDPTMPEEVNRVLTDQISDLLLTHSPEAEENLVREGIDRAKVHFVGNVMIDTLVRLLPKARARSVLQELDLRDGSDETVPFVLVTLHRPSNVDNAGKLQRILTALAEIGRECAVVLPMHPRTRQRIAGYGLETLLDGLHVTDPLGYLDFLCLQEQARVVLTDSGGIQEETTYLGVPCFTVRANTERPVTITQGTNTLVGDDVENLGELVLRSLGQPRAKCDPPQFWDGKAAERIADIILASYG